MNGSLPCRLIEGDLCSRTVRLAARMSKCFDLFLAAVCLFVVHFKLEKSASGDSNYFEVFFLKQVANL